MRTTLAPERVKSALDRLRKPKDDAGRQPPQAIRASDPVHTVYGGAQLFRHDTIPKIAGMALKAWQDHAQDSEALADALTAEGHAALWTAVHERVSAKLKSSAVEDYRIDFEDGFGVQSEAAEDEAAVHCAEATIKAMSEQLLPSRFGIRIKSFSQDTMQRAVRTLDLYLSHLLSTSKGRLPKDFVVTLPKVETADQVSAFASILALVEQAHKLKTGSLRCEIMIESGPALLDSNGLCPLPSMVKAALGRLVGVHLGVYDYTSSLGLVAQSQTMDHALVDFARHMLKIGLAGFDLGLADGATNIMPIGPHRGANLDAEQKLENTKAVHHAWRLSYKNIQHALDLGIYQGWDLHPAQIPVRYAAVYEFFLAALPKVTTRLGNFLARAARATMSGLVFDDAASGQGLLNFFQKGMRCGAITATDLEQAGLNQEELGLMNFDRIVAARVRRGVDQGLGG